MVRVVYGGVAGIAADVHARNEAIPVGDVCFVSSGSEFAVDNMVIDGLMRNDGLFCVHGTLTVNGTLINNGEVQVGW